MNRTVLITGASGFLGAHCLARVLDVIQGQVHAAARSRPTSLPSRLIWHQADLRNPADCEALIGQVRPTHLLHCAWVATPGIYSETIENLDWVNGSAQLAHAFGRAGGRRFVALGSSAEYDAGEAYCNEDLTPIRPATLYGKCKVAFWQELQAAAQTFGFSAAWARIFLPYGPGDNPKRLLPSLITALDAKQEFLASTGEQLRDFTFSTDIADMVTRLLWMEDYGVFNIGTGRGVTVRHAMELAADMLNARHLLRIGARPMASGEPMVLVADMTKTANALVDFAPTSLEEGVARFVNGFCQELRRGGSSMVGA